MPFRSFRRTSSQHEAAWKLIAARYDLAEAMPFRSASPSNPAQNYPRQPAASRTASSPDMIILLIIIILLVGGGGYYAGPGYGYYGGGIVDLLLVLLLLYFLLGRRNRL
jgi:hypothetical protein